MNLNPDKLQHKTQIIEEHKCLECKTPTTDVRVVQAEGNGYCCLKCFADKAGRCVRNNPSGAIFIPYTDVGL